jgi:glyoxylase-like metal-dependent hydrolase (beta-lactamase superfamily II)
MTRLLLAGAACLAATALVSAQQAPAIRHLPVQKSVHMLVGPAGNSVVQVGDDGVLVVDSQPADVAPALRAAIHELSPRAIHTLIDTHVLDDRAGGDEALVKLRGTGATQQVRVIAHEAVLDRLVKSASDANRPVGGLALNQVISLPINSTYTSPGRDFYLNGESIVLYHAPDAHTDGDTIVHFRGSDVLAVGDLFRPDTYPVIDLARGGSVNGLIAALNRILELTVPARYQEGGTYVVPGRGRLSDEADVVEYRDMVTIVRDRVRALIGRGMTLAQVKAARPSSDYDPEFGGTGTSSPDAFVESIHRSLGGK